jgi:hypothetical protein
MGRKDYEERKQARIERYEARAAKARSESSSRFNSDNINTVRGLQGQPVLVGHHSEKRHRKLLERADNDMRKSFEASKKADYYAEKAVAAETNDAISSDDPEAVVKLKEKIADAKRKQEIVKAANKIVRRKPKNESTPEKLADLTALGCSESAAQQLFVPDFCGRIGFPSYVLTNNNANIKRMEQRLVSLQRLEQAEEKVIESEHYTVVEDPEDNRFKLEFPGKPSAEVRKLLKSHGFRWSPRNKAWQRMLNGNSRTTFQIIKPQLDKILEG